MTYREKLQREHPECVEDFYIGGCKNCPENYGYEEKKKNAFRKKTLKGAAGSAGTEKWRAGYEP